MNSRLVYLCCFIFTFLYLNVNISHARSHRELYGSSDFQNGFMTPSNNNANSKTEFWPSFDDEKIENKKLLTASNDVYSILTTIVTPSLLNDKEQNLNYINERTQSSLSATKLNLIDLHSILVSHENEFKVSTPETEIFGDSKPKEVTTTATTVTRTPHTRFTYTFAQKDKNIKNIGYGMYEPWNYNRSVAYNAIIIILGAIGGACILAIIFGAVVIARSQTLCICRKSNQNQNNNGNNNNNNNNNIENSNSLHTLATYLDKRSQSASATMLPEILNPMKQIDHLNDPKDGSIYDSKNLTATKDDSVIYSNTSMTDTSETRTSKLCSSGVIQLEKFERFEVCSPYAAINIDDIKGFNIVVDDAAKTTSNNNSEVESDETNCVDTQSDNTTDNHHDSVQIASNSETDNSKSNNINNLNEENEPKQINTLDLNIKNTIKSPINSQSSTNISESNTVDSSAKESTDIFPLSPLSFSSRNINNSSSTLTSSTAATASNASSTFYSLRVNPVKTPNIKTNSYRIQAVHEKSLSENIKTSQ